MNVFIFAVIIFVGIGAIYSSEKKEKTNAYISILKEQIRFLSYTLTTNLSGNILVGILTAHSI